MLCSELNSWSLFVADMNCWNPAFDVTPASLITGIVTEFGVFRPNELKNKLLEQQQVSQ